jgi:hypothetical protein
VLDLTKLKLKAVVGVLGAKLLGLKADCATLFEEESIVQTKRPAVWGVVGIDNRFWILLMTIEVVEIGKVRGRLNWLPLYWAELRLKRLELRLKTYEL